MVIFHKIRYKNILSFGNMWTEVQLDANPTVLIQGNNGGGKSTMLEVICFALFGKPFRKITKPKLVNHKNKKDLVCEIEFTANNNSYLIRRGINPQIFEIYENGNLIDQTAAVKDYQAYVEKSILHFDYQIFTQIVILGKATYTSFLRLQAADRRKFIENILDISIFSVMNEVHKGRYSELKDQTNSLNAEIKILREKITIRKQYINDLEDDIREQRALIIHAIDAEEKGHRGEIARLTDMHAALSAKRITIDVSLKDTFETKLEGLFDFRSKFNMKLSQINDGLKFFETNLNCPTCSQPITEELRDEKKKTVDARKNDLEKMIVKVNADIETMSSKLNKMVDDISYNTDINYQLDDIHNKMMERHRLIDACEARRTSDQPDRSKIEAAITILNGIVAEYDRQLDVMSSLVEKAEYFELMSSMLKDTGIKSMIIKKYIPVINQLINKYLKKFGFFVKFVLDEAFDETIYSRGIDQLGYENFSEGEKLRIDLAVLFAWRDVAKMQSSTSTNLLIFDEILDGSMDAVGTEALIQILAEANDINLFVVSHSPDRWVDKFKNTLRFGKVAGFSKLLE